MRPIKETHMSVDYKTLDQREKSAILEQMKKNNAGQTLLEGQKHNASFIRQYPDGNKERVDVQLLVTRELLQELKGEDGGTIATSATMPLNDGARATKSTNPKLAEDQKSPEETSISTESKDSNLQTPPEDINLRSGLRSTEAPPSQSPDDLRSKPGEVAKFQETPETKVEKPVDMSLGDNSMDPKNDSGKKEVNLFSR